MSERDERPGGEDGGVGRHEQVARNAMRDGDGAVPTADAVEGGAASEGGDAGSVGALDGAAAAGGAGAVAGRKGDSLIPQEAPDPSVGPD